MSITDIEYKDLMRESCRFWIRGQTYQVRDELKNWGARWHPAKKSWYLDASYGCEHVKVLRKIPGLIVTEGEE
jgi:hypothetical protein